MRILILSSVRLDSGTGLRLIGIAEALAKLGHDVYLTGFGLTEKITYAKHLAIKKRCGIKNFVFSTISNIRFSKMLKSDIIIASKAHPVSCLPAMLTKNKAKIILDFDDLEHDYWKNLIKRALLKIFEKTFPKFFNYVTTHNDDLKLYILKNLGVPESKIIFLQQGINTGIFKRKETDLAEKLKIGNKKVIIYAAHLGVAASDLDIVFDAVKNLEREDVKLLVIGDGEKLEYYKILAKKIGIEDAVIFTGYVKHEDMPKYLSVADAAVNFMKDSPANRCRASIKIREYLAFGLPTVCNIFGPDLESFRNFVYDFETEDIKSFENALIEALEDKEDKANKAKGYMQKWDWGNIAEKFEKELERIVRS